MAEFRRVVSQRPAHACVDDHTTLDAAQAALTQAKRELALLRDDTSYATPSRVFPPEAAASSALSVVPSTPTSP